MASGKSFEKIALTAKKQLKLQFSTDRISGSFQRINGGSLTVMPMPLSQEKQEMLKWTAEGKTAVKTTLVLAVSEHTGNFLPESMQNKFNAPDETQVASYAAALGLH